MAKLIGQSLGRYHILEQLGEGGMAVVYKAFDTRLERNVAIKVILPSKEHSEKFLKRFEREAKALAQLSHPNIVKVIDFGEHEGLPYLVMEYLPGGTLKQKLAGKPMPWQEAARILIPIARALAYAHERKIVHRDIKPSNILITESNEPMLSDFGIAKMLEAEETLDLTGTGVGVGTPEYMSPEQAQGQPVDGRSDMYSLGVVFYEMVTGRKPYQADTPMAVVWKLASEPLPSPKKFDANLPDAIEQVLLKLLAKKPENRYVDLNAFITAIENMERGRTSYTWSVPVISKQFRRIALSILGAVLVITAITLLVLKLSISIRRETSIITQPPPISISASKVPVSITQTPAPQFVEELTVPSTTNLGVKFKAAQTGLYIFQYKESAYSGYPGSKWFTTILGFRGEDVQWRNSYDLNYDAALFVFNSGEHATKQEAIGAAKGEHASVKLNAGDWITLVAADGKSDYGDNTGSVLLDVIMVPDNKAGSNNQILLDQSHQGLTTNLETAATMVPNNPEYVYIGPFYKGVSEHYKVSLQMSGPIDENSLSNFNTLILSSPDGLYFDQEIKAILSFVKGGGSLLVLSVGGGGTLDEILTPLGVHFIGRPLASPEHLDWGPWGFKVSVNSPEPLLYGVNTVTVNAASGVKVDDPNNVILWTDASTWVDTNENQRQDAQEQSQKYPVVVRLTYGKGRVVILPAVEVWGGFYRDNEKVFLQSLGWLMGNQ